MGPSGRKYAAEFLGTACLVFFGCGSAMFIDVIGLVGVALAFGLSIVCMAYCIGNISGCHINPAVSLAMLLCKRMNMRDFVAYAISQVLGAVLGAGLLVLLRAQIPGLTGLGVNGFGEGYGAGISSFGALITEMILTFFFVLCILGVTGDPNKSGQAGIVIGLALVLAHLLGIHLTGTSVNPARSLAPALFEGGKALSQLWVFIVGPFVGAAVAAAAYRVLVPDAKESGNRPTVRTGSRR